MTILKAACDDLNNDANLFNNCNINLLDEFDGWASAQLWDMSFGGNTY